MPAAIHHSQHCYWISSAQLAEPLSCASFDVEKLIQAGTVRSIAQGRASAWFIQLESEQSLTYAVLRHYYRGGQIAKISADSFFWSGIGNTRAVVEYRLLEQMFDQGLPVPEPLGARVTKRGAFYTCDLITREIENAQTLAATLAKNPVSEQLWISTGKTIRHLHDHQVWHADLNANNILLDNNEHIYVIDFDRCKVKKGNNWKHNNLARLKRSLEKQLALGHLTHFNEANWLSLLNGYQGM